MRERADSRRKMGWLGWSRDGTSEEPIRRAYKQRFDPRRACDRYPSMDLPFQRDPMTLPVVLIEFAG